ncbi:MAG TPA: hypothetical protein VGC30_12025, partial [Dokdonella sp.]
MAGDVGDGVDARRHAYVWTLFAALAAGLAVAALAWHLPMMLWDQLDFAPLYEAWRGGTLAVSAFASAHNGHLFALPYATLLATTSLSAGAPWADAIPSLLLLLAYAGIVVRAALRDMPPTRDGGALALATTFLALYPGDLADLQWGWQVAVFFCLLGTASAVLRLSAPAPTWRTQLGALGAAALAFASFATALALVPTALVLIALRDDLSPARRLACAAPWLAAGALALAFVAAAAPSAAATAPGPALIALYTLNYLGAGVARFATALAPLAAAAALASALLWFAAATERAKMLPWLGFVLFGVFGGLATALGRAGAFGSGQAFAARYVGLSMPFWIGWIGIAGVALRTAPRPQAVRVRAAIAFVALLALVNAVQMTRKAARTAAEAREIAGAIRTDYPQLDDRLLHRAYADDPAVARRDIDALHRMRLPPFDPGSAELECAPRPGGAA